MMTDDEEVPQGPEDADLADNADLSGSSGGGGAPADAGDDEGPQRDAIFSKTHPAVRAALDDAEDYLTDNSNPPKQDALFSKTHPALQAFVDSVPAEIRGEGWFGKQIQSMNDWVHGRDLADQSQAHSEEYVANLAKYKDGLVKMVQNDPTAVSVALDSIKPSYGNMIKHLMVPDDQAKAIYADLAGHATSEVTEAAVRAMATKSSVLADRMLQSSLGVNLSDTQTKDLQAFIHAQAIAMGADHAAQKTEVAKDQARSEAATGHRYGEELVNPVSGKAEFANGWASRMMADPGVAPEDKGALMNMYGKLQTTGDVAESNGHVVRDAVNQMQKGTLTSKDIWNAVGRGVDGLSMNDAKWLNGMLHDETPGGKANRDGFAGALNDAATQLMGKAGEESAAGRRNFNNYAKWLVGGYQQRGVAGLDPDSDGYMFKQTTARSFQDPSPMVYNTRPSNTGAAPTRQVGSYFRRVRR